MVTKRFSRTDSTENQSFLQLLRRSTYQVTSRLSSCLTTTLLTCQLISLLGNHSACFMQIAFRLKPTQLHCALRNSAFYFFKNTLQLLTILTLHVVTVTAYFLNVSVTSMAQCKDPTVIGTFAIVLFAVITVTSSNRI